MLSLFVIFEEVLHGLPCIVEEDLDFRGKVNKVLGNKSFIAFLSLFDFIQKQNYV